MVCVVVRGGKWNNAGKEREGGKILRKRAENAKKKTKRRSYCFRLLYEHTQNPHVGASFHPTTSEKSVLVRYRQDKT